jgi:PKD repeat protein
MDGSPVPIWDTPSYFSGWPSYTIDTPGMANRIMEWLTWSYGIGGELYYHATAAYEFGYKTPWTARYIFGGNAAGNFFLPGRPDVIGGSTHIPIETVRLKLIREGLEDYEYLAKVAQLGDRGFADAQARTLATNTYTWSHDPAALYAARTALAQRILQLQGSAPPDGGGTLPPPPANQAPTAAMTTSVAGLTVTANGTGSQDPDGTIVSWAWTWGDGSQSTGTTSTHPYAIAGTYTVTLTVTDNQGAVAQAQRSVAVSAPAPSTGTWTRWEETDSRIVLGPGTWHGWSAGTASGPSGGGYLANGTAGATLTLTFTGTAIKWLGALDSCSGRATVTLDGVNYAVDNYRASGGGWQNVAWERSGLAATTHTFKITVLGTQQAASCGPWIYFDAVDVMALSASQPPASQPPPSPSTDSWSRWEETDSRIVLGPGTWHGWSAGTASGPSGGGYLANGTAGATLTLTFTGTAIKWLGALDSCSGRATVTLDGVNYAVDNYRASGGGWQNVAWERSGLAATTHTFKITVLGTQQAASCGPWIYFDAVDVLLSAQPVLSQPMSSGQSTLSQSALSEVDPVPSAQANLTEPTVGGCGMVKPQSGTSTDVSWLVTFVGMLSMPWLVNASGPRHGIRDTVCEFALSATPFNVLMPRAVA